MTKVRRRAIKRPWRLECEIDTGEWKRWQDYASQQTAILAGREAKHGDIFCAYRFRVRNQITGKLTDVD